MRLLDKKTIVQQKNLERKREIDEGVKLANKVDSLRETAAKEEKNLFQFRDANLAQVKKDIDRLLNQKEALNNELEALSKQREVLQEPLDREWVKVRDKQKELDDISEVLSNKEKLLDSNQKEYDKRVADLDKTNRKLDIMQGTLEHDIEESKKLVTDAKLALSSARTEASKLTAKVEGREKLVVKRELDASARERDIINSAEKIAKDRRELDLREIAINDRYATLLRTEARIKKHG